MLTLAVKVYLHAFWSLSHPVIINARVHYSVIRKQLLYTTMHDEYDRIRGPAIHTHTHTFTL